MKRWLVVIGSLVTVLITGAVTVTMLRQNAAAPAVTTTSQPGTPELTATKVIEGLTRPWDIAFLPDGTLLFSERNGSVSKLMNGQKVVLGEPSDVNAIGEGGMMGLAVDPEFAKNRYVYTCFNSTRGDVRAVRWQLGQAVDELTDRKDIVVGISSADSGRHSGCQLAFGPDGNLWIGTGDAADESQPQDQTALGGKILRVNRDGQAAADNPNGPDRRVFSYGHRNTQALAFYRSVQNGSYGVSVEHGPNKDDEVNELKAGNFGWDPGPGYDESPAMTDTDKFPSAVPSVWSSGTPTIAPSGADFLRGDKWGRLQDWLAVAVLKDQQLLLLNVRNGSLAGERSLFQSDYGRLRAATVGPDGNLYLSTDNGDNDAIIKVVPASATQ